MKKITFRRLGLYLGAGLCALGWMGHGEGDAFGQGAASGGLGKKAQAVEHLPELAVKEKDLVDGGLDWLEKAHPDVRNLSIACNVQTEQLAVLRKLKKLERLSLSVPRVLTDADLAMIPRTGVLKDLSLSSLWSATEGPSDDGLSGLLSGLKLRSLSLSIRFTARQMPKTLDAIGRMSTLSHLYLPSVEYAEDQDMQRLGGLRGLTALRINVRGECELTDKGLAWIGQQSELRLLHLSGLPKVQGTFLVALRAVVSQAEFTNVGFSDEGLKGRWFEGLNSLRLDATAVTPDRFAARLPLPTAIQTLSLGKMAVNERLCVRLAQCKALQNLTLTGLKDPELMALAKSPTLKSLSVGESRLTADGIKAFAAARANVTLTMLDANGAIIVEGPKTEAPRPQMSKADLPSMRVTDSQLVNGGLDWLEEYSGLRRLNLYLTDLPSEKLAVLEKLAKLDQLSLKFGRPLTDRDLEMLKRLTKLKSLDLMGADYTSKAKHQMSDEALAAMLAQSGIQELLLEEPLSADAMPKTLAAIGGKTQLTFLNLRLIRPRDEDVMKLAGLVNLTHLDLGAEGEIGVTDEGLGWIGSLTKLKVLKLHRFPGVRGAFLTRKGMGLTTLFAYNVGLEDESLKGGWVSRLGFLLLGKTKVTPNGLAAQLPAWGMNFLNYADGGMTEVLAQKIVACQNMQQVTVAGLDAKNLEVLGRGTEMTSITIYESRLTPDELEKFKKAHPKVKVESWERKVQ